MSENKQITLIDNLSINNDNSQPLINNESIEESIIDLSLPLNVRIKSIEDFYKQFGHIETIEIVNRLSSMYQMSGTKILEKYMYELTSDECKIHTFLKLTAAKSLCYFDSKKVIGYQSLDNICKNFSFDIDISTPVKIESICLLMSHPSYKKQSRDYFCNIINDVNLDCNYRYKTILSLENKNIPDKFYFIKESSLEFINNPSNQTLHRILAGQLIIQKCEPTKPETKTIENILFSFATNSALEYNLRADSADVILKLGCPENKIKAKEIIMMLGRCTKGSVRTIFDNAQNVHTDDIEESITEAIEFLSSIETKTITNIPGSPFIDFDYVKKQINNILQKDKPKKDSKEYKNFENKKDAIKISLNRIYLDRALYSKFKFTLINILLKVWTYICSHDSEIDMKKRLLEELVEMSGTCSSGFAGRLVNVISGFGDFNLKISWRDQIIANFTGRLNAKVRDIVDPLKIEMNCKLYGIKEICIEKLYSFQEKIVEEMTVTCDDYQNRLNFLKFFRKNMLSIRTELYSEFKSYITDSDFDLYFRSAISSYETGGYV